MAGPGLSPGPGPGPGPRPPTQTQAGKAGTGKALYSTAVACLGFVCFAIGATAVGLPLWGYFDNDGEYLQDLPGAESPVPAGRADREAPAAVEPALCRSRLTATPCAVLTATETGAPPPPPPGGSLSITSLSLSHGEPLHQRTSERFEGGGGVM
ncbi:hypothetical protein ONE63_005877 [Megalurothrips usitatus]|uniref:Uncharacterized protein n=1 Tax=Megalurothrips usitatus TaxID=439358 RepID=A0AAV7XZF5_9NEOP|nr:hypothetical protein ONE63_005877 [Megalurothrips usitatus]